MVAWLVRIDGRLGEIVLFWFILTLMWLSMLHVGIFVAPLIGQWLLVIVVVVP